MPAISTLTLCEHTYAVQNFASTNVYDAINPPDWFTWIDSFEEPPGTFNYSYQVLSSAPLGVHTIYIDAFGNSVLVIVNDCSIHIHPCLGASGSIGPIAPPLTGDYWDVSYSSADTYGVTVFWDLDTQTLSYLFTTLGTFWITLQSNGDPEEFKIYEFNIINCFKQYDGCETGEGNYPLNIAWYNRDGGWQSYVWYSRRFIKKQIGDNKVFKSTGRIRKKISIEDVYNGAEVPSGLIPDNHQDYVEEMKYTIQAFEYNPVTEAWDIPILIDASSFTLRQEDSGMVKYDFEYIYATELIIQSQ